MSLLARFNARLESALGALLAALTVSMVLVVLWQVATRLASRLATARGWTLPLQPSQWTEELASFLLAWIALLGAAYALRRGEHMGYDALFNGFGARGRARCTRFVQGCVIAFALVLVAGGVALVAMTLQLGQTTPALRWPMGLVYVAAPLSGGLMMVFAAERVFVDDDAATTPSPSDRYSRESGNPATLGLSPDVQKSLDSRFRGNDEQMRNTKNDRVPPP